MQILLHPEKKSWLASGLARWRQGDYESCYDYRKLQDAVVANLTDYHEACAVSKFNRIILIYNSQKPSTALQLRCPANSLKREDYVAIFFCIQRRNVTGAEILSNGENVTVKATMLSENGKTLSSPVAPKTIDTTVE